MNSKKLETIASTQNNSNKEDNKVTTIIFDLGNVVIPYDINEAVRVFTHLFKLKQVKKEEMKDKLASEKMDLMRRYEKGLSSDEFCKELSQKWKVPFAYHFAKIAEKASYSFFKPITPEMKKLIIRVRSRYKTAALSNTVIPHRDYMLRNYHLGEMFDHLFFSCDLGKRKPEPQIYSKVLDTMNISADNAVFIDDYKKNVDAAREIGIDSILFTSPNELEKDLNQRQITF
ncbi:MAG: HAD family phosphatase [archaeon]